MTEGVHYRAGPAASAATPRSRQVFCNRTLNLRAIQAIGFDMDYTLIHYNYELWEAHAYAHTQRRLAAAGLPVEGLEFDAQRVTRGLILDLELGNIVKASRFGYVVRASHGSRMLDYDEQRDTYSRTLVDLSERRWVFLNTLFSLSEGCLYAQLVDLLDAGRIDQNIAPHYRDLYSTLSQCMGAAHMEGELKAEIIAEPERFVLRDAELPLALLDLMHAGKRLMVITNSEWSYTRAMMAYAFDEHLPGNMTWRDLFELVFVDSRKPAFFTGDREALQVVDDAGLLAPKRPLAPGQVYYGGNARAVESYLGLPGERILYVGDHVYADVHVSKEVLRWRTALILRELEAELIALDGFASKQRELDELMRQKEENETRSREYRLSLQRAELAYGPPPAEPVAAIREHLGALRQESLDLDERLGPLAREASEVGNERWGPITRAGADKSRVARAIERYADIYTSRVANLLHVTPFAYLRAPATTLPHDACTDLDE
jgi:5'-nucleotidase